MNKLGKEMCTSRVPHQNGRIGTSKNYTAGRYKAGFNDMLRHRDELLTASNWSADRIKPLATRLLNSGEFKSSDNYPLLLHETLSQSNKRQGVVCDHARMISERDFFSRNVRTDSFHL